MSEKTNRVEVHGCIVCGRQYNLLVVYLPSGRMLYCTVTSPGGHVLADPDRPLVACDVHSRAQIDAAVSRHYPGLKQPEDEEED